MRLIAALLLLLIGCNRTIQTLEPNPFEPLRPNTYIEDLTEGIVRGDIIVQGAVSTSDSCGNFYQSMIIEDVTGVMELQFSFYDVYSLYKRGEVVSVKLFDKVVVYENGILSVRMGSLALVSQTVLRQGYIEEIIPRNLTISEIDSTQIGSLVRISGGEFNRGGDMPWSGEQRYSIGRESVVVYTTPYADYANETLPLGKVSLTGIVTLYKGEFQLKMSSPSDCQAE